MYSYDEVLLIQVKRTARSLNALSGIQCIRTRNVSSPYQCEKESLNALSGIQCIRTPITADELYTLVAQGLNALSGIQCIRTHWRVRAARRQPYRS